MTLYENPGKKTNWKIDHSNYKLLPELQDAIWEKLRKLSEIEKIEIFKKYNVENLSLILTLSIEETLALARDLNI